MRLRSSASRGGSSFIDLAWERAAAIGDADIDFELNQNATLGLDRSTTGTVQLNRTLGDSPDLVRLQR